MYNLCEFHKDREERKRGEEIIRGIIEEKFLKLNKGSFFPDCTGSFSAEKDKF